MISDGAVAGLLFRRRGGRGGDAGDGTARGGGGVRGANNSVVFRVGADLTLVTSGIQLSVPKRT